MEKPTVLLFDIDNTLLDFSAGAMQAMEEIFREAGLPMILSAPGRGTAKNEHLAVYGLDENIQNRHHLRRQRTEAAQLVKAAKRKLFSTSGNGFC